VMEVLRRLSPEHRLLELIACCLFESDLTDDWEGKITEFEIQVGTGVKIEILEIATGEAEIVGRRPVALCEARERSGACSCPERPPKRHCARSRAISGGPRQGPERGRRACGTFNPWSRFELPSN